MIFYGLITVIMLNLIFGILIDTFASIRNLETNNELDQINKCFICHYEKGILDQKLPRGFDNHFKNEHYMWNYIFYLMYLEKKGIIELSALESYVWDSFSNKIYDWLPYLKSLELEQYQEDEDEKINNSIKEISENQVYINDGIINMINNDVVQKKVDRMNKYIKWIQGSFEFLSNTSIYF